MIKYIAFPFGFLCLFGFQVLFADTQDAGTSKLQLVKVATLNTIDANKEFQKNVQLVQQQRALAAQVVAKLNETKDKKEIKKLESQLDTLQQKLNENNQLMFKTYGFSLNRNYVLTVEKSHIFMWVNEEEAQAINKRAASAK
jgi:hypothetical protein